MKKNFEFKLDPHLVRKIRHFAEFAGLLVLVGIFQMMSSQKASDRAGKLGRKFGPKLKASQTAMNNLKMALPGKTQPEYDAIIAGMWDNLARVIIEYHELEFYAPDCKVIGIEFLQQALADGDGQAIFMSGHIGNWEIMAPYVLAYGTPLDLVYRAPNNPWVDRLLAHYRSLGGKLTTIPKSRTGTRQLLVRMQEGHSVGMLIDQKYNEGLAVPFFGHLAMTSPAYVQLAQKFDCPLLPVRIERLQGTQFSITFYEPLKVFDDGGQKLPVETVIAQAHALLESWIRERPEQWLWLHRRWIDSDKAVKRAAAKTAET